MKKRKITPKKKQTKKIAKSKGKKLKGVKTEVIYKFSL